MPVHFINPHRFGGAAASATTKAGTFRSRTTTGVDAVSLGFQPKAVVLSIVTPDFSETALTGSIQTAWLISDGTTTRCVSYRDSDASATSQVARSWTSTLRTVDISAATAVQATVSFTATGFELDWTTVGGAARSVCYWAIGGTDISAKVLTFNRATTGSSAVTGAGFQPKALIGMGAGTADVQHAAEGSAVAMVGFADDDADEAAVGIGAADNSAAADTSRRHSASALFARDDNTGASPDIVVSVTTLDSDGFTYNASTHPASSRYYAVLCLGGAGINASELVTFTADSTTGAGTQTLGSLPFEPNAGLLIGAGFTAVGGATTARLSLGAFDNDLNQWSTLVNSVDAADPMETDEGASNQSALVAYASTDGNLDAVGQITAKDSDSVDVAWDASKIATQFIWSALLLDLA